MSYVHQEFYAANSGIIEAINSEAKRVIDEETEPTIIEKAGNDNDVVFIEGENTAEDFLEYYADYVTETAQELAELVADAYNSVELHEASGAIIILVGLITAKWAIDQHETGKLTKEETIEHGFLSYQRGIFRESVELVRDGSQLREVQHVRLEELEEYGSAETVEVELTDETGFAQKLDIQHLGSAISHVSLSTRINNDPLMHRCAELLISCWPDVMPLLTGRYTDEADLDLALSDIWLEFLGTSKEQEVGPLLDELRDRAIAAKESTKLVVEHAANLPTAEQLQEFVEILAE